MITTIVGKVREIMKIADVKYCCRFLFARFRLKTSTESTLSISIVHTTEEKWNREKCKHSIVSTTHVPI